MLQVKNISKEYKTGDLRQRALDGVSLSLRDNEFVSILGPSGSGKTTLLNIIGGLDRYDEGDLIINGVSTKNYKDRDWDSYRNHTIGFVFQSYNLIPHQTVLSNVELALTISGIGKGERRRRAKEVLEKVGLKDHLHKRPSQMSGGQMQRVAIARALVNNPDILLADEPTGALDSDTSVQIMELLKEVAKDRLVVMVTHNPELAKEYSTRIVELRDGRVTADSDPFEPDIIEEPIHNNMGKASMSFFTALWLSFNNLWTKKARTILVAIAGSIGIIGIAMILSMSTGADKYIKDIEEESLQSYPLQINDTSFDMTAMYAARAGMLSDDEENKGDVKELKTVTNLFSGVKSNDLQSLRAYFESGETDIYDNVQSIEYDYNLSPQIYAVDDDGYRKVNPDTSFSALGFTSGDSLNSMLSAFTSTDSFHAMPENNALYQSQYELKAGKWPEKYNECVVVVSAGGRVYDTTLYTLGLKDPDALDKMVKAFAEGSAAEVDDSGEEWYDYDDFLGISFRLVPACDYYTYDKEYKVWSDRSDDEKYMTALLKDAETISIVGVIEPMEGVSSPVLYPGIGYTPELVEHIIALSAESDIVKEQLKNEDVDVFTGKRFDDKSAKGEADLGSLFSIDEDALSNAFDFDLDAGSFDLSGMDFSSLDFSAVDLSDIQSLDALSSGLGDVSGDMLGEILKNVNVTVSEESMRELFTELLKGFSDYAASDEASDISKLPDALSAYLQSDEAAALLRDDIREILENNSEDVLSEDDLSQMAMALMLGYRSYLDKNGYDDSENPAFYITQYLQSDDAQSILDESARAIEQAIVATLISPEQASQILSDLLAGYDEYAEKNALPTTAGMMSAFSSYLASDEAQKIITKAVTDAVDASSLKEAMTGYTQKISDAMGAVVTQISSALMNAVTSSLTDNMNALFSSLTASIQNAFNFNPNTLSEMFSMNMDANELKSLMVSMLSTEENSFDANLKKLGYADINKPSTITIYPTDFDGKTRVKEIIADYNEMMEKRGEDDKVISYTDTVDVLMSSVTDIVDVISYVLIAFVAISLVVSSIMIGVITYISVLERKKEIGILRAIGASKRNISQMFNAETFIIGALAGAFGVGFTYLILIPGNAVLRSLTDGANIKAILPPAAAAVLVALSVVLTLIGGLIPSKKAAKNDPVIALRTE